jgi:hypothetical protein
LILFIYIPGLYSSSNLKKMTNRRQVSTFSSPTC